MLAFTALCFIVYTTPYLIVYNKILLHLISVFKLGHVKTLKNALLKEVKIIL